MISLDQMGLYGNLDPANMISQLHALPQQCLNAWNKATQFKLPQDYSEIDKLIVCGMGGSAIGGDLIQNINSAAGKPIVFVNRDYGLPHFVDSKTLIIFSSYSGNTEETLSAFDAAQSLDCKKLVITTGGKLKNNADKAQVPVFHIDLISPPRLALGYSFIALTAFLRNLGFLKSISIDMLAATQLLESMLSGELSELVPADSNPAKQLATGLYGKVPVIYGAEALSGVVRRWKTQINENSKTWSFTELFPELNHNAIVGYSFPSKAASELYVVLLSHPSLHPRILKRYRVTVEILDQHNIEHQVINSRGEDILSQILSLIYYGDWTSYYLAILNGIDPTPVSSIDYLKKRIIDTD